MKQIKVLHHSPYSHWGSYQLLALWLGYTWRSGWMPAAPWPTSGGTEAQQFPLKTKDLFRRLCEQYRTGASPSSSFIFSPCVPRWVSVMERCFHLHSLRSRSPEQRPTAGAWCSGKGSLPGWADTAQPEPEKRWGSRFGPPWSDTVLLLSGSELEAAVFTMNIKTDQIQTPHPHLLTLKFYFT